jgi:hypothetical protein
MVNEVNHIRPYSLESREHEQKNYKGTMTDDKEFRFPVRLPDRAKLFSTGTLDTKH